MDISDDFLKAVLVVNISIICDTCYMHERFADDIYVNVFPGYIHKGNV